MKSNKSILSKVILAFVSSLFLFSFTTKAQTEANFVAESPTGKNISEAASELLKSKVQQILDRNSAGMAGIGGVFAVVPELNVVESKSTEGLVQNVSVIKGELVLDARNRHDGSSYYSVTVPLQTTVKQAGGDQVLQLAKSIKVTDPVYVRFIRTARKNIASYFEQNCETILARARTMEAAGNQEEAVQLLYAVPATAPCVDEAKALILTFKPRITEPEKVDTVFVEVPVIVELPVPTEEVPAEETPATVAPVVETTPAVVSEPQIIYSKEGWKVNITECKYQPETRQIRIDLKIVSENESYNSEATAIERAISADGDTFRDFATQPSLHMDYPEGIPVKVSFLIKNVKSNPGSIATMTFSVSYRVKVEIRNLDVK